MRFLMEKSEENYCPRLCAAARADLWRNRSSKIHARMQRGVSAFPPFVDCWKMRSSLRSPGMEDWQHVQSLTLIVGLADTFLTSAQDSTLELSSIQSMARAPVA